MIKAVVFDDQITVYWDRPIDFYYGCYYKIMVDEKFYLDTNKTHFEIYNLDSEKKCIVHIYLYDNNNKLIRKIGCKSFTTKKHKERIDVTKPPYNAIGNGKVLNTKFIQQAFNDCKRNQYIYFPPGVYLTGALNVHSNSEIYIDKGAVIKGTTNPEDYLPRIISRFEGNERLCYASLINIGTLMQKHKYGCSNVIIRGGGKIHGGGRKLEDNIVEREKNRLKDYLDELGDGINEYETTDTIPGRFRGRLINISSSEKVILADLELFDGPSWNTHMIYSRNIETIRCKIGSKIVKNGDGWNPDSSEDCTIFDCDFSTTDDCIAIKSGKNLEGWKINIPSRNIRIFDCRVEKGGGVALGSEMSGGIEDVKIWDLDFKKAQVGISIKTTEKRGGYIRDLKVFDSVFPSVYITASVNYNNDGEGVKTYSDIGDFYFDNLLLTGKGYVFFNDVSRQNKLKEYSLPPIYISGLKDKIKIHDVTFTNCTICNKVQQNPYKCEFSEVDELNIENIKIK